MAKKKDQSGEESRRQSRKEVLLARNQERQTRQVRLVVIGIAIILVAILLVGVVNELFIKPSTPVANINGVEVPLRDWRDRVRLQRAQIIVGLEDLAETFNQDIGQVQQFAGQQIGLLEDPQTMGQLVLDQMVDEQLVLQAAAARSITVTDEDVQKEIEESFSYFGGAAPTALPSPTETIVPTPSVTPIPTAVITDVLPTSTPFPTTVAGPTGTPLPTSTPVSLESFQESLGETLDRLGGFGVEEADLNEVVKAQLYQELLTEALVSEEELPTTAEHASFYFLSFDSEEEAQEVLSDVNQEGFLDVWNGIRSQPPEDVADSTVVASEVLWRNEDELVDFFGPDLSGSVFSREINEPSAIILVPAVNEETSDRYYVIMVSGREIRPLSEAALSAAEQELFAAWLETQRIAGVDVFERWRANVPQRPILDRRFLMPPTPGPPTPALDIPEIQTTPEQ
jgi:hypothetical protein